MALRIFLFRAIIFDSPVSVKHNPITRLNVTKPHITSSCAFFQLPLHICLWSVIHFYLLWLGLGTKNTWLWFGIMVWLKLPGFVTIITAGNMLKSPSKHPVLFQQTRLEMSHICVKNIQYWSPQHGWKYCKVWIKTPGFGATNTARNVTRSPSKQPLLSPKNTVMIN